jgi:hypothetical protein
MKCLHHCHCLGHCIGSSSPPHQLGSNSLEKKGQAGMNDQLCMLVLVLVRTYQSGERRRLGSHCQTLASSFPVRKVMGIRAACMQHAHGTTVPCESLPQRITHDTYAWHCCSMCMHGTTTTTTPHIDNSILGLSNLRLCQIFHRSGHCMVKAKQDQAGRMEERMLTTAARQCSIRQLVAGTKASSSLSKCKKHCGFLSRILDSLRHAHTSQLSAVRSLNAEYGMRSVALWHVVSRRENRQPNPKPKKCQIGSEKRRTLDLTWLSGTLGR